jgi:CRP/FNR family transcriptional regulator, cyclic AMP receptor protein
MKFIELLCTRLRWISEHVELVMLQSMPARLASTILRLAERPDGASASPTIAMTQAQVSAMAGMSRESANKVLAAWAAEGWVGLEHGTLRVLQFEALRAVAGES